MNLLKADSWLDLLTFLLAELKFQLTVLIAQIYLVLAVALKFAIDCMDYLFPQHMEPWKSNTNETLIVGKIFTRLTK